MCRLMGRRRAVKVGYAVCGRTITASIEHRCTHGNCGSSPRALTYRHSSAGRAAPLQGEGRGFNSLCRYEKTEIKRGATLSLFSLA